MSEQSERKRVSRRSTLAFLGYAAAFGLVASSALLTVTEAEAQATSTPATPTTPPTDAAKSGTERRQERRTGRAERRQERRTGRARRHDHRAKKVIPFPFGCRAPLTARCAPDGAMMDKVQRAILENQIILAEALWMLLHSQGTSSEAMLQNVSARIKRTRELLEEHDEGKP